jgi:putative methyltransferase (TIGR04325 family)
MPVRWKQIVRQITPPLLLDCCIALRARLMGLPMASGRYVWQGIYSDFNAVPVAGPGFSGEPWANGCRYYLNQLLANRRCGRVPADESQGAHLLLPLLARSIRNGNEPLKILDFGGGPGTDYLFLRSSVGEKLAVKYHVVEGEIICAIGTDAFVGDSSITFGNSLPSEDISFDVVYLNGVLQFIENFRATLRHLCNLQPTYILAVRHPAGEVPTFATAQVNVSKSILPCWFFNSQELIDLVTAEGYRLEYQSSMRWPYDMSNFPEEYRLDAYHNLLFVRSDEKGDRNVGSMR